MTQPTILNMIENVKISRCRLSKGGCGPAGAWSAEENQQFIKLMLVYGSDFSLLQHCFPHCSRAQIRRKFRQMELKHKALFERHELARLQQRRKEQFDRFLENEDLICDWNIRSRSGSSSSFSDSEI